MARYLAALFSLLLSGCSAQAGTLKGVVLANEAGGPPIAGATVGAVGANPTKTGATGTFTLRFPNAQPGNVVHVTVGKAGYVVLNWFELKVTLPKNPDDEPLTLLLCKEEEREERSRRFYRLKSWNAVEETYKKKIKELEKNKKKTADAIGKLQTERDQAKAAAEETAEELARLRPIEMTALYEKAMSLFSRGRLDEALELLSEGKLQQSIRAARRRRVEGEKAFDEAVQSYLLRARLLTAQLRLEEAEKVYMTAVEEAPDSALAHFALAAFRQVLDQFEPAYTEYLLALEIARRDNNDYQVAETLSNLGVLSLAQRHMGEARKYLEESLAIRRRLAENISGQRAAVGLALNSLGLLDCEQGRVEEARRHFKEALEIYHRAGQQNLDIYAVTLGNLASLDHESRRMDEAQQHYEEALRIQRELALQDPAYLWFVATTLNNLGNLEKDRNRIGEARQRYEDALRIFQRLPEESDGYLPSDQDLAKYQGWTVRAVSSPQLGFLIFNNLGNLDTSENRIDEARTHFSEALGISRRLARRAPEVYSGDVASTLINIGRLDYRQDCREEALGIYRKAPNPMSDSYLAGLAMALNNLGSLDSDENRIEEARVRLEEALKTRQGLAQQRNDKYALDVAETLINIGSLEARRDRIEEARRFYLQALEIYRHNSDLPSLALALSNLGNLDAKQRRMQEARAKFDEALGIRRQLALQSPDAYLPDVAFTLNRLGLVEYYDDRMEEARQCWQEALSIYLEISKGHPEMYAGNVADIQARLKAVESSVPH